MTGAFRELPYEDDDLDAAAQAIIEAMGIDLPSANLQRLLREARHVHRMVLSDWRRRNDPDWQPPRRLPRGEGLYDYGETMEGWEEWWREVWGRPPGNPGLFRGTDVAMPPLCAIYHLVNRFWRETMRLEFHPDFGALHSADTDAQRFPDLNRAAQIFLLVAQDAGGSQYDCRLCGLVTDAYYRRLDRRIPRPS